MGGTTLAALVIGEYGFLLASASRKRGGGAAVSLPTQRVNVNIKYGPRARDSSLSRDSDTHARLCANAALSFPMTAEPPPSPNRYSRGGVNKSGTEDGGGWRDGERRRRVSVRVHESTSNERKKQSSRKKRQNSKRKKQILESAQVQVTLLEGVRQRDRPRCASLRTPWVRYTTARSSRVHLGRTGKD